MTSNISFPGKNDHFHRAPHSRRFIKLSVTVLLAFAAFLWLVRPAEQVRRHFFRPGSIAAEDKSLVPLEIHIMSKCPDARDCLEQLILPAMEEVSPKVNFTMSFIGKSTEDNSVECMHGETECLGNIVELCAASLYPDPKVYLGFTMCLSNQYRKIPQQEFVEDCALEHGLEMGKLNSCMSQHDGQFAIDMLRRSFERSESVGATKSCTVRLNNKVRCIRDGGIWTDCEDRFSPKDLVKDINELYSNSGSS